MVPSKPGYSLPSFPGRAGYEVRYGRILTANILFSITACQAADYPRGLMAHTSLISSGSFSEISTFMPGLKAMMQIATQLRV